MTAQDIIDHLRRHVLRDYAAPYLWSDDVLLLYLNEAYFRFCRDTHIGLDNQTHSINIVAGTHEYALDDSILLVRGVAVVGRAGELRDCSRRILPAPDVSRVGPPSAFAMDEAARTIRIEPTPDAAYTAVLRCSVVYPELAVDDELRIPRHYQLGLCHGVAEYCYAQQDADQFDAAQFDRHKTEFEVFLSRAKHDVYRLRTGTNTTVRQNWTGKRAWL